MYIYVWVYIYKIPFKTLFRSQAVGSAFWHPHSVICKDKAAHPWPWPRFLLPELAFQFTLCCQVVLPHWRCAPQYYLSILMPHSQAIFQTVLSKLLRINHNSLLQCPLKHQPPLKEHRAGALQQHQPAPAHACGAVGTLICSSSPRPRYIFHSTPASSLYLSFHKQEGMNFCSDYSISSSQFWLTQSSLASSFKPLSVH